ncbi:MAG: hydrogenase maturation protein [Thiovulaceae bacterium]|nr:hydrogenase maturation protein [Sulfurimonadaceae bacterium]
MKILLLVSAFNSLTQRVFTHLKDNKYEVIVEYFISEDELNSTIQEFNPDIIFAPYLKKFVPKDIYEKVPTYILHPGIKGDRGHNSLDNALRENKKEWGVVILRANEDFDGGDIYAEVNFKMRDDTKASIYRDEVSNATLKALDVLLKNIKDKDFIPTPQLDSPFHNYLTQEDRAIDWENDSSKEIIKKINYSDSYPGVKDEFFGIECYLFGAWEEERFKAKPKEIVSKRDGAICIGTKDGAIWISHLKEVGRFKLPSTYVLKDKIQGVKEDRLPLLFDMSYKTFYEISVTRDDDVSYLCFNFHNGAMSSQQCIRLKYAFDFLRENSKVIVLVGAKEFFSNGIHLNILEDSKKQGEDGWSNINAMNDLVKSIIFADDVITVASLHKNAGAGGLFLALACDKVIAREGVVVNPHYKTMGLDGSEYHTYTMAKRVGQEKMNKLLDDCLPISVNKAKEISLIDEVYERDNYFQDLKEYAKGFLEDEDAYDDFIYEKQDYLEYNKDYIDSCKEKEIKVMHPQFWDKTSEFHILRHEFVYKTCPIKTPQRLKSRN